MRMSVGESRPSEREMEKVQSSRITRPLRPMTQEVKLALEVRGLMEVYRSRPAYQQNDYLAWIARAKRPETAQKRLQQMLDELEKGGVYMKMAHPASRRQA